MPLTLEGLEHQWLRFGRAYDEQLAERARHDVVFARMVDSIESLLRSGAATTGDVADAVRLAERRLMDDGAVDG